MKPEYSTLCKLKKTAKYGGNKNRLSSEYRQRRPVI